MKAPPGQTLPAEFGDYTLEEFVAFGGTSEIFTATAHGVSGFEKTVIIKRILPQYSDDRLFVNMLIDEARICSGLQHANIVQIFDLGQVEDRYFIAMEHVNGVDLHRLRGRAVEMGEPLPIEIGCAILGEALEGLEYAHRAKGNDGKPLGIIHRDFNPTNILVSLEGEVKVTDFGIAKAIDRSSKTITGVLKGKYGYMSPEQVTAEPVDLRTDIFTAGITLWELITGRRMFEGVSFLEMLRQIKDLKFPDVQEVCPDTPDGLAKIVRKALQLKPGDRYPSARKFKTALEGYLKKSGVHVSIARLESYIDDLFTGPTVPAIAVAGHADDLQTQPITVPIRPTDEDRIPTSPNRTQPDGIDEVPEFLPDFMEDDEDTEEIEVPGVRPAGKDLDALVARARTRMDRGEFWRALELLDDALQLDPEDAEAVRLHARAKQSAVESVFVTLGDLNRVPGRKMSDQELMKQDFDNKTGFLISLVDGHLSFDEIITISGQPQLDAMRALAKLLKRGVVEVP